MVQRTWDKGWEDGIDRTFKVVYEDGQNPRNMPVHDLYRLAQELNPPVDVSPYFV